MPQPVALPPKALQDYVPFVGQEVIDGLSEQAAGLRELRVLAISATSSGGGVAVMLRSLVPALRSLGLRVDWLTLEAEPGFFGVTKHLHNLLQGEEGELTPEQTALYERVNRRNGEQLPSVYDVYIVHDPQPAAVRRFHRSGAGRWAWRSHVDTSNPNQAAWEYLQRYLEEYDAFVSSSPDFVPAGLRMAFVTCIAPAIDPLHPISRPMPDEEVRRRAIARGLPLDRPLIGQFSRFDPWKDQEGVVRAHRLARERVPGLQLVLSGPNPEDDPQGQEMYERVCETAGDDPDVHLFLGPDDREANALQRACQVVVQKSLREGFGLVVSEALWKGRPVVASDVGGIRLQMTGPLREFLVRDVEGCADRVADLLTDPALCREIGELGQRHVRENFLLPRLLRDELEFLARLAG